MRILIIVLTIIVFNTTSYADRVVLTEQEVKQCNESFMTKQEQLKVKSYVTRWNMRNKYLPQSAKIMKAVLDLTEMADYKLQHKKASDVLKGQGNCVGYSLLFKAMMDKAGIKTNAVISVEQNHMWNEIEINGRMTDFDLTAWEILLK